MSGKCALWLFRSLKSLANPEFQSISVIPFDFRDSVSLKCILEYADLGLDALGRASKHGRRGNVLPSYSEPLDRLRTRLSFRKTLV